MAASLAQTQNHGFFLNSQCLRPLQNGIANGDKAYGTDMIALRSMSYTSLRDLLPASPSPVPSPTRIWADSWRDIPIKDPLVQCAAWAYLQPMVEARDDGGRVFSLKRLKKTCCGLLGCFNDVVMVVAGRWFCQDWRTMTVVKKLSESTEQTCVLIDLPKSSMYRIEENKINP